MKSKLRTRRIRSRDEIIGLFDEQATHYSEQHGNPGKLLAYRTRLIREAARLQKDDTVLDVGCGTGHHLIAMAEQFRKGIGIDFSETMVQFARMNVEDAQLNSSLTFCLDDAETLATMRENSIDVAMCVGVLEHIPNRLSVVMSIHRVLKSGGRFVCLTPNGDFVWYTTLAPSLDLDTRHLSTDHFLSQVELRKLLRRGGFEHFRIDHWSFIPKGDMSAVMGGALQVLDSAGKVFRLSNFRGGLLGVAFKT